MINGLLTLRGAWDKLRTDPILKFLVVGITFYGMSTFEGPMMSVRTINALSHYTDYTIGHVHAGALGWNGFIAFGMIYYLLPRLWKVPIYSQRLVMAHFWSATIGIVLYIIAMWTAGITQGLMWRAFTEAGTLQYPDFIQTVIKLKPFYWIRVLGGGLYFAGIVMAAYNVIKTVGMAYKQKADLSDTVAQAKAYECKPDTGSWHHRLEGRPVMFTVLTLVAVMIGGMVEIIPMLAIASNIPTISSVKPYSALELEGRDIYVREGCYTCHSQMVRPFRDEVLRYGEYSKGGEFVYDHPFQFGSKRTGPDLHRVGGKYPDFWHYRHMKEPAVVTPGSIMPPYPWLYSAEIDLSLTKRKLEVMKQLGVPYSQAEINDAVGNLNKQASEIASGLIAGGAPAGEVQANREIIALIAYLQRLGKDIKGETK